MDNLVILVPTFVCVLVVFLYYEQNYAELTYVTSKIDNIPYLVRNRPDKEKAADIFAVLNTKITKLIRHLTAHNAAPRLSKRYDVRRISESLPTSKYTSYSVNKGQKIVFCIRSKNNPNEFVDINTLFFVVAHELAHLETKSTGHTKEFWDNMRLLLKAAIKIGIWNEHNYRELPVKYCGIEITDTPLNN
tara:strand:+ start:8367 stop:8936 length:570 start_codon:yes stop_codon:yes gene_type:complete